ncbi:MAG: radical SAM protein [Candidatus Gracilibacteria bacterium]|nr:radical SAM protein [Candidatus Gracilibacteria bacterium]
MNKIEIYKHLSWKIKYEAGDMPYPPVMFWKKNISKNDILGSWKNTIEYIKTKENNHNMGLYVHIPFCYTHCFFCTCITKVEHNEKKYDDYLDLIEKESELFSNIFSGVKFNTVYVGGGTPTILSAKQIDRFYNIIKKYFDLSEVIQIMTEGSPYTTTEDKMKILSKHGINKMTFGVQSLDTQTLKTNNRFQQFDDVKNAVDLARKYGIEYINLDIMAGIPGQDLDGFKETIDLIKTLNPTTVHVNAFMPTKNTNYIKAGGIYNYENIKIRNEMELYGKFLEDDRSKITDLGKDNIQLYNSHNFNSSILGLGYGAISHAFGQLHYTKNSFPDYKNFLNNGGKGIFFTGYKLNLEDEIITYFINNLRKGISYDKFYTIFGIELKDTFIYRKILFLIDKGILININKVIKFSLDSDVFCSIYSKYLYKDEVIKNFLNYFFKNQKDYKNLDLMLKQFFTN